MRWVCLLLVATAGLAQSPQELLQKAPPQIDAALRARVTAFYQAFVDAKFRLADQYVAEDSKDLFFAAAKEKLDGFDILRINYLENFTKADVVVVVKSRWVFRGMSTPTSAPVTTHWKVVNGDWFWYVPPGPQKVRTPFGMMTPGPTDPAGSQAPPGKPADMKAAATAILQSVSADRTDVKLAAKPGAAEQITISNGMPGHIRLRLDTEGTGVKATLDKEDLGASEKAKLSLERDPATPGSGVVTVKLIVEPTNQVIPIRVNLQ